MPTGKKKKKVRNLNNNNTRKIEQVQWRLTVPPVEKVEQRFEFEDSDAIQMNYLVNFVAFCIVAGVAAAGLPSE